MSCCPTCGHRLKRTKLSVSAVLDIRKRAAAGEKHEAIAADFKIANRTVGMIALGYSRASVGGPRSKRIGSNDERRLSQRS
jgi:hypothetical protein